MSRRDREPELPQIDNRNARHMIRAEDHGGHFASEELDEALDKLTEKRSTTREEGLLTISTMLSTEFQPQIVSHNPMTLGDALLRGISSSSGSEIALACRVLSLIAVTVGAVESEFSSFEDAITSLSSRLGSIAGRNEDVVRNYISTLAILVFATGSETTERETLSLFFSLATRTGLPPGITQEALNAWSLVVSGVSAPYVCGTLIPDTLQPIINVLYATSNADVRIAVGEAVALLVEIFRDSREDEDLEFDLSDLSGFADIDELQDRLQELQRETTHTISKTALSEQRKQFRRITASLEGSLLVSEKFLTNARTLPITVDGWSAQHQLRYFRKLFEGRLIEHMCQNPLLPNVLNYTPPSTIDTYQWSDLTTLAKKHAYSHTGSVKKKHTRSRIRLRSDKSTMRSSDSFAEDDE